jgi:hypothetical protein
VINDFDEIVRQRIEAAKAANERAQAGQSERENTRRKPEKSALDGGGNPFTRQYWDVTRQFLMLKENRAQAEALEERALINGTHGCPPPPTNEW